MSNSAIETARADATRNFPDAPLDHVVQPCAGRSGGQDGPAGDADAGTDPPDGQSYPEHASVGANH